MHQQVSCTAVYIHTYIHTYIHLLPALVVEVRELFSEPDGQALQGCEGLVLRSGGVVHERFERFVEDGLLSEVGCTRTHIIVDAHFLCNTCQYSTSQTYST